MLGKKIDAGEIVPVGARVATGIGTGETDAEGVGKGLEGASGVGIGFFADRLIDDFRRNVVEALVVVAVVGGVGFAAEEELRRRDRVDDVALEDVVTSSSIDFLVPPRFRFLITSVRIFKGRKTPCNLRNNPQALHKFP